MPILTLWDRAFTSNVRPGKGPMLYVLGFRSFLILYFVISIALLFQRPHFKTAYFVQLYTQHVCTGL